MEAGVNLFTDLVAVLGAGTFLVQGLDGFAQVDVDGGSLIVGFWRGRDSAVEHVVDSGWIVTAGRG